MKYLKILLLLLFMGVLQTKGQEDSVMFKVAYKATFKGKQESKLKEDFQVLEVGREYSEYYSIYDREFQHKSDSLKNAGLSDIELASQLYGKNGPDKGETYQVFKNYPTTGKLTYTYVIFNFPYLYEEDMPAMKWDLAERLRNRRVCLQESRLRTARAQVDSMVHAGSALQRRSVEALWPTRPYPCGFGKRGHLQFQLRRNREVRLSHVVHQHKEI